jgi:ATP-dependent helicase/nuclease subunit A
VLKSPLFGLSEEQLFRLAFERGRTRLHQRLGELSRDDAGFAAAQERFAGLLAEVDYLPPFELYGRLLGEGGALRQLVGRLGSAAIEPIEAFLAQALAYERSHPPSLQGFLHWLRADTTELIRDPDRPRGEVRVLTVHGAKGLEAPIVFLVDTTFLPDFKDRLLWHEPPGLPLWRMGSKGRERLSGAAYEQARRRQLQEQRRLLYVGLTRAREHLIIAGCQRKSANDDTWHALVEAALPAAGAERIEMRLTPALAGDGWRLADPAPVVAGQLRLPLAARPPDPPAPPPWLHRSAPAEARGQGLSPSRGRADEQPAALSPLQAARAGRFRRGRLIHRLLQSLPGRPPDERRRALADYLALPALGLTAAEQAEIAAETLAVLALPELAALFGPGSRAEVPLAGTVGEQVVFGQVDRLAVTENAVLVIDYKTNRAPPATPAEVPVAYLRQMAAYQALLEAIYPGRPVRCALLWTEGPGLMALDAAALARFRPDRVQA